MTCRSFTTLLLFQMFTSYTHGSSVASNATRFNSSHVVGFKPALPGKALPISSSQIHAPAEEPGSSGLGENRPSRTISADSVGGMGAGLPTMSRSEAQLDFKEENAEDVAPRWRGRTLQPDGSVSDRSLFLSEPDDSSPVIKVSFSEPYQRHRIEIPAQEVQGGDPTSWTSEFYDYLSPEYSTTESYADDELSTPADMEDENIRYNPAGAAENGVNGACLLGFVRRNGTCQSPCDVYTSYCLNGGQCYVVEGIGAFCRCNLQNYVWNKGSRCESVITEFQVMCIVVSGVSVMLLILFLLIVFFSKRLHVLKTENSQLRKRSKSRPQSLQHNDNFSLSTVAEGSQANVRNECGSPPNPPPDLAYYDNAICQNDTTKPDDPVETPVKEDESLNVQTSLTPKHENTTVVGAEDPEEVNSLKITL